jgi:hypothetical protein
MKEVSVGFRTSLHRLFTFALKSGRLLSGAASIGTFEQDSFFFSVFMDGEIGLPFDTLADDCLIVKWLDRPLLSIPLVVRGDPLPDERTTLTPDRDFITTRALFLEFDKISNTCRVIYLILDNNRIAFNDKDFDTRALYEPRLNDFPPHPRYCSLQLNIPLHPLDEAYNDISLQYVSQRIPLWYEQRTSEDFSTSGSDAGKWSCGYWVDDERDDNNLRIKSIMRYGRLKEPEATLACLHNFPNHLFFECGTYSDHERHLRASPDLLCKDIHTDQWSVFELKASYMSVKFPDYYIPQLYWEMMVTRTKKATLVRYQSKRAATPQNKWAKQRRAMAYTISYDEKVAQMLLDNVAFVRDQGGNLKQVVQAFPKRFQQARAVCAGIAAQTPGRELEIPTDDIDAYEKSRWTFLSHIKKYCQCLFLQACSFAQLLA